MYCTILGGTDDADHARPNCGASASSTPADTPHPSDRKGAAARFRVDCGISSLEWQTIRMGSGTMGSSAPPGCGLGGTEMEQARKWMGFSRWILAVICEFNRSAGERGWDCRLTMGSEVGRSLSSLAIRRVTLEIPGLGSVGVGGILMRRMNRGSRSEKSRERSGDQLAPEFLRSIEPAVFTLDPRARPVHRAFFSPAVERHAVSFAL